MANKDLDVKVSAELVVNKVLHQVLSDVWNKYHICVSRVNVGWYDVSTVGETRLQINSIDLETSVPAQYLK